MLTDTYVGRTDEERQAALERRDRAVAELLEATYQDSVDRAISSWRWDPLESTCRHASLSIL